VNNMTKLISACIGALVGAGLSVGGLSVSDQPLLFLVVATPMIIILNVAAAVISGGGNE